MNEIGYGSENEIGPSGESWKFNREKFYARLLEDNEEFRKLIQDFRGKLFRLPDRNMSLDHTENSEFKEALYNTSVWKECSEIQRKMLLEAILSDELMEDPVLLDAMVKKKELKAEEDAKRLERVHAREAMKDEVWPEYLDLRTEEQKMDDGDYWPNVLEEKEGSEKS